MRSTKFRRRARKGIKRLRKRLDKTRNSIFDGSDDDGEQMLIGPGKDAR